MLWSHFAVVIIGNPSTRPSPIFIVITWVPVPDRIRAVPTRLTASPECSHCVEILKIDSYLSSARLYDNALKLGADRAAAAYADTGLAAGEHTFARYYERLRSPTSGGQKTIQACRKAGSSVCGPECTRGGKHRWWPRGLYRDQRTGCLKAAFVPAAPGLWTGEGHCFLCNPAPSGLPDSRFKAQLECSASTPAPRASCAASCMLLAKQRMSPCMQPTINRPPRASVSRRAAHDGGSCQC